MQMVFVSFRKASGRMLYSYLMVLASADCHDKINCALWCVHVNGWC